MTWNVAQYPITELPTSFVEAPEGLRSDDAVDGDSALLLKRTNRTIKIFVESIRTIGAQPELGQARPNLVDGWTRISSAYGDDSS